MAITTCPLPAAFVGIRGSPNMRITPSSTRMIAPVCSAMTIRPMSAGGLGARRPVIREVPALHGSMAMQSGSGFQVASPRMTGCGPWIRPALSHSVGMQDLGTPILSSCSQVALFTTIWRATVKNQVSPQVAVAIIAVVVVVIAAIWWFGFRSSGKAPAFPGGSPFPMSSEGRPIIPGAPGTPPISSGTGQPSPGSTR